MSSAPASYALVDAPWGPIHVAATRRGVVAVGLLTPTELFTAGLERRLRTEVRHRSDAPLAMLDRAIDEIEAYLAGTRRAFDLPVDLADRPAWDRAVLAAVGEVPWGEVTSYGRVARSIDRPGAARAVGGAVGRNPVALLVPCHRVIAGDGTLGGYGGDWYGSHEEHLELKRDLLSREGIEVPRPGRRSEAGRRTEAGRGNGSGRRSSAGRRSEAAASGGMCRR
jgi:methylated-DNA-[protein]-cysteine S-methyltransferase